MNYEIYEIDYEKLDMDKRYTIPVTREKWVLYQIEECFDDNYLQMMKLIDYFAGHLKKEFKQALMKSCKNKVVNKSSGNDYALSYEKRMNSKFSVMRNTFKNVYIDHNVTGKPIHEMKLMAGSKEYKFNVGILLADYVRSSREFIPIGRNPSKYKRDITLEILKIYIDEFIDIHRIVST